MSTPDPLAPPPKKRNPWLVGCLVVSVVLVLGAGAVLLLGIYAVKRGYDEMAPQAKQALEQAREAASQVRSAAGSAQVLAQGAETQARLAMAARTVATTHDMNVVPCPPDPARATVPVDAEWFRRMSGGVPRDGVGTPWMRHRLFENLATAGIATGASDEAVALAAAAADRDLSDAGTVAVIHTTTLRAPRVLSDGSIEPGRFQGFVQLVKYPVGDSICLVPFSADSPAKGGGGLGLGRRVRGLGVAGGDAATSAQQRAEEDFQGAFWAAEEAALGK